MVTGMRGELYLVTVDEVGMRGVDVASLHAITRTRFESMTEVRTMVGRNINSRDEV